MSDIELIYTAIRQARWGYSIAPRGMQYYFEANIFSWGFLHV